jgi:hypothetical protein
MPLTDDLGPTRSDGRPEVVAGQQADLHAEGDAERDAEADRVLGTVAHAAVNRVPGMEHAGVLQVDPHGAVRTRAATSDLARELDRLQHRLGEGPAFGLNGARLVVVPQLGDDPRWPRYAAAAAAAGVRAQLTVRVAVDDVGTVAALTLCSTVNADVHPDAEPVAELFAGHAAAALGHDRERGGLTEALRTRELVGQATGIVADRYEMSQERAFAFLVRAASQSNMLLRELAQELIDRRNGVASTPHLR